MKLLIWILTFLIGTILNTLLGEATGIKVGAVLLYIVEYYIAKSLCSKWDEAHKEPTNEATDSQQADPMPPAPAPRLSEDTVKGAPINEVPKEKKIRFCRHCGFKLIEDSEFCSNCGTEVQNSVG